MALDDYMEPEVAVAVAVTALVASPKVRRVLRQGAVYGLAGLMAAGDAITHFTKTAANGIKDAVSKKEHDDEHEAATEPVRRRRPKLATEGAGHHE